MPRKELADISVIFVRSTEKAICVTEDGKKDIWLPKSQCQYDEDAWGDPKVDASNTFVLTLPRRLASEKEFAGY